MKFIVASLGVVLVVIVFVFVIISVIELFHAIHELLNDQYDTKEEFYTDAFLLKKIISKFKDLK